MAKCKYKESCGLDAFLPYQPPLAQAGAFMPHLGCLVMDRAARCSPLPVFHPCKVWTHDSALSASESSLDRKLQIWLSSRFTMSFCVACVNGE